MFLNVIPLLQTLLPMFGVLDEMEFASTGVVLPSQNDIETLDCIPVSLNPSGNENVPIKSNRFGVGYHRPGGHAITIWLYICTDGEIQSRLY